MFKKAKENKKGFTLAELLIVVAIIAVLVAISIPIFTSQLEKSRDSVTLANLRSAYAEAQASYLTETKSADNVTINKNEGVIETITVSGVQAKGTVAKGVSDASDMAFPTSALTNMDNTPGSYTVTFTYDANGKITAVSAVADAKVSA